MDTFTAIELIENGDPAKAFRFSQLPKKSLKNDDVRIKVDATGINFADILARLDLYPEAPKKPFILGYEVVGTVSEVGAGVTEFSVGDRVVSGTMFGGYANEVVSPALYVIKISEAVNDSTALSIVTQGCTAVMLFEHVMRVYPEDLVMIHAGASGVGLLLCQLALHNGNEVIATCGSEEKVQALKKLGVQTVINYREQDFVKEVKKKYQKRRVDVCFDSIGGSTFRKSFAMLGANGRMGTYGIAEAAAATGFMKKLALAQTALLSGILSPIQLLAKSKTVAGVNLLSTVKYKNYISRRVYERVFDLVEKGILKPFPGKQFKAENVADAHRFVEDRKAIGKVYLDWKSFH